MVAAARTYPDCWQRLEYALGCRVERSPFGTVECAEAEKRERWSWPLAPGVTEWWIPVPPCAAAEACLSLGPGLVGWTGGQPGEEAGLCWGCVVVGFGTQVSLGASGEV